MTKFSFNRSITDYSKVQIIIGAIVRGKKILFRRNRIKGLKYLNIGCGPNTIPDFVNLDYSWSPKIDVCWDLNKNWLPFSDKYFRGIFSEHCFEHISFDNFIKNMKEIYRILETDGILRLIMPDGELYFSIYENRKKGINDKMPYEDGYISPMHRINGIFRNHGHQFIYDFETVNIILKDIGFKSITKEKFNSGRNKKLLKDSEWRSIESLYIEAIK